jgi:hypothetical protein
MKTVKQNGEFVFVQNQAELEAKALHVTKTDILAELDKSKNRKGLCTDTA